MSKENAVVFDNIKQWILSVATQSPHAHVSPHIELHQFPNAGRGVRVSVKQSKDVDKAIMSIPLDVLITIDYLRQRHQVYGPLYRNTQQFSWYFSDSATTAAEAAPPKLSAVQAVCLFLLCEKLLFDFNQILVKQQQQQQQQKQKTKQNKSASVAYFTPFIASLPMEFTNALYFTSDEMDLLPPHCKLLAHKQLEWFNVDFAAVKNFVYYFVADESKFKQLTASMQQQLQNGDSQDGDAVNFNEPKATLQALTILHKLYEKKDSYLSRDVVKWSFCVYYTRCVYLQELDSIKEDNLLEQDRKDASFALVPLLDCLNHSFEPNCEVKFNKETLCFDVLPIRDIEAGEELCFTYGAHDNSKLLVEYGFIVTENPNDAVLLDAAVREYLQQQLAIPAIEKQLTRNLKFLKDKKLIWNYTCTADEGLSLRTQIALRIMCLTFEEFSSIHQNGKVFSGAAVSDSNEALMKKAATAIFTLAMKQYKPVQQQELQQQERYPMYCISTVVKQELEILSKVLNSL